MWFVQQIIGGWRQNAVFQGTLKECEKYMEDNNLYSQIGYGIVSEEDYKVDYL